MSVCLPVEISLEIIHYFPIADQSQFISALDKRTNAYRMVNNRFRFLSELGRDTANIDDMLEVNCSNSVILLSYVSTKTREMRHTKHLCIA